MIARTFAAHKMIWRPRLIISITKTKQLVRRGRQTK